MKKKILWIIPVIVLVVFLGMSAKVIDKGTEGLYTGEVTFNADASSSDDWGAIVSEITQKAEDAATADLSNTGDGVAVALQGTIEEFISKASGKKNSIRVVPAGYSGTKTFEVQLGSIYSGTCVRDVQSVKSFGDFTNQTEWSQYAKALNSELHETVVVPLAIDENSAGKQIELVGVAVASGDEVVITPVQISIQ